ncbi:2-nitropropane dioxygenase [Heyndrickxia shackletonii]|uniref:Probable nitronate monooxygenase n=1 Tax=Heyndrickxia shackletonii TaxID=157838 RepID=A0A0Q3X0L6_9BACI|nr:nitronate monooxygenase [Heyndrickxia shackletonii]KQL55170.1 2-nitropropane dioxygenase [Heyndrickxia shackletonii]NEY98689.1 nitronate monooxygenase [Heyndrickxia shackletonii]
MNQVTTILGIERPIIQGGMGNISNAKLTAAVSEAGGLGTIGTGTMNIAEIENIMVETKHLTKKPFAVNIPVSVHPEAAKIVELIIKHDIPVVSLSAGNPAPFIPLFHDKHVKVMVVTASVKHAKKAEEAGADIIVAEGVEAAGINSPYETTTMTLIPQIVDSVDVPVVAAGGIADGRGMLAAFALGAQGVQMGTRFVATKEAPFSKEYKKRIIDATDHSTVVIGRSLGRVRRVLDGEYAKSILWKEKNGLTIGEYEELTTEEFHCNGALDGNEQKGFMNSGQIAGLIRTIPTVKDVIDSMLKEYEQQLKYLTNLNVHK